MFGGISNLLPISADYSLKSQIGICRNWVAPPPLNRSLVPFLTSVLCLLLLLNILNLTNIPSHVGVIGNPCWVLPFQGKTSSLFSSFKYIIYTLFFIYTLLYIHSSLYTLFFIWSSSELTRTFFTFFKLNGGAI